MINGQPIVGIRALPSQIITPPVEHFVFFQNDTDGLFYAMLPDRSTIKVVPSIQYRGEGTSNAQQDIFLLGDPGVRYVLPDNTLAIFNIQVTGIDTVTGEAGFTQLSIFLRHFNGVCSIVNGVNSPETPLSLGDPVANNWTAEAYLIAATCELGCSYL